MKKIATIFLVLTVVLPVLANAQEQWYYLRQINFPPEDSVIAVPYLCALNGEERLYVISSYAISAKAHNAIYYADSTDAVFKRFIDFNYNGDSDTLVGNIGSLRGIAIQNKDIYVTAWVPYPRSKPSTVMSTYYYRNADTNLVEKYGFYHVGSGYGTYSNGLAVTKDTMLVTGVSYKNGPRWYNFSYGVTSPTRGSYVPPADPPTEPGGLANAGFDVIRDVAVLSDGDYKNTSTPFYTSRNSDRNAQTGGIAVWAGGTDSQPANYVGLRVADAVGHLAFSSFYPYGITIDHQNRLWVAGVDTNRRWVKCFDVSAPGFAVELFELPGQFSLSNPVPEGAPMEDPCDVAVTADGRYAYVIDYTTKSAYVFTNDLNVVSVREEPAAPKRFTLEQNYPNPFNPVTRISFTLTERSHVRLKVTNALGQEVAVLADGLIEAGVHMRVFDALNLPSGVYFYSLTNGATTLTNKMMLLK